MLARTSGDPTTIYVSRSTDAQSWTVPKGTALQLLSFFKRDDFTWFNVSLSDGKKGCINGYDAEIQRSCDTVDDNTLLYRSPDGSGDSVPLPRGTRIIVWYPAVATTVKGCFETQADAGHGYVKVNSALKVIPGEQVQQDSQSKRRAGVIGILVTLAMLAAIVAPLVLFPGKTGYTISVTVFVTLSLVASALKKANKI